MLKNGRSLNFIILNHECELLLNLGEHVHGVRTGTNLIHQKS
jgi:hypothetical protein